VSAFAFCFRNCIFVLIFYNPVHTVVRYHFVPPCLLLSDKRFM
jgi:hypothetical protein